MSGKVPLSSKARLKRASKLFEEFTGHDADSIETIEFPDYDTVIAVGELSGVMYDAVRDGELEHYIHEFDKTCRPLLCVSHDGKQLYIVGGRYTFKETGINDGD
jgi:hypothetical protein